MKNKSETLETTKNRRISDEYIVGLIDGEGTISITRYPDGRERPQVLIFSTFKKVLDMIKTQRNLTAPLMKVSRVGDNLERKKDCYRLQVRSRDDVRKMFEIMKNTNPIIKRKDFEDVHEKTKDWVYQK